MKKIYLIALFLSSLIISYGRVIVVSNQGGIGVDFNSPQAAADAASNGDTIYIQPSPLAYPSFQYLDKKLAFFGAGFRPDKDLVLQSIISGMGVGDQASVAGSPNGSSFEGIVFGGAINLSFSFTGSLGLSDISFRRCEFRGNSSAGFGQIRIGSGTQTHSNYLFESNYFNGSGIDLAGLNITMNNMIFRNNLVRSSLNNRVFGTFTTVSNILIDHNLFYNNGTAQSVFNTCQFLLISNNVFINKDPAGSNAVSGISNSTFTNNITFGNTNPAPWILFNNINGGGNIANQDPLIAAGTALLSGSAPDNPLLDYSIAAGPANNAGSDGKDMGLLYDNNTTANWNFARNALLPYVRTLNITNPTVSPGGTLNVNITAIAAQ